MRRLGHEVVWKSPTVTLSGSFRHGLAKPFADALNTFVSSGMNESIPLPIDENGNVFSGSDLAHLVASIGNNPEWTRMPVFVKEDSLSSYGLSVPKDAVPVKLDSGTVYNLSECDLLDTFLSSLKLTMKHMLSPVPDTLFKEIKCVCPLNVTDAKKVKEKFNKMFADMDIPGKRTILSLDALLSSSARRVSKQVKGGSLAYDMGFPGHVLTQLFMTGFTQADGSIFMIPWQIPNEKAERQMVSLILAIDNGVLNIYSPNTKRRICSASDAFCIGGIKIDVASVKKFENDMSNH